MPWIEFLDDFDWMITPRLHQPFKAGTQRLVTSDCRDAAVKARKARDIERPEAAPAQRTPSKHKSKTVSRRGK